VVIAGDRDHRPQDFPASPDLPQADSCPFCAGREDETTPALASYCMPAVSEPGRWQVRVVSNLYPAFVGLPPGDCQSGERAGTDGPNWELSRGRHEVIIESAIHRRHLTELSPTEVELVFSAYRDRLRWIRQHGRYAYALVFKNSGRDAGMSREHLHSQLVALPDVPPLARREQLGSLRFYRSHRRCVFCHLIDETLRQQARLVLETETVVAFCPYASRVAYEVWILPKRHEAHFDETIDATLSDIALSVRELVRRLQSCLGPFAYNYVLHSNPFDTCRQDHYHWHIEILPRTSRLAGLEWGTGLLVNTMPPELAAKQLRDAGKI
jgi:UDPglucose--hexose-1-phosphate uridylyltransferase